MPGPLGVKLTAAFVIAQIIFLFSGASFAPLISAIVLPVMIGTDSWSYVISAAGMTLLVIAFHALLVKSGTRGEEALSARSLPDKGAAKRLLFRTAFFALMLIQALNLNSVFIAAPPLLVAFTEWTESGAQGRPHIRVKKAALLAACAAIGAGSRLLLSVGLGLPTAVSAAAAAALALAVMISLDMFVPPAGALMMLAMLVPESALALYPVEAGIGAFVFCLAAAGADRVMERGAVRTGAPQTDSRESA
ncbi:MAG: hypothetical protein VZQ84_01835 [Anaerovoracaceae bacterium]|nr:hypothetical protein [Anaerovoracaceae bacterium]